MKNTIYSFCLFVSSLLFVGCSHNIYTPQEGNLLMLSEKGDIKMSAGLGFTDIDEPNHNIQLAYSPKKNFGVALNYSNIGGFDDPTKVKNSERGGENVSSTTGEAAVGYYQKRVTKTTDEQGVAYEKSTNNFIVFDAYAGYGRSNIRKSFSFMGSIDFDSQYYFLQGGMHFQNKFLGLSYTMRTVVLDYLRGDVNGMVSDSDLIAAKSLDDSPFTFLESSFRIRAGREKVQFYFSRNWMMAPFNEKQLNYNASSWHVGLVLYLFRASPSGTAP